MEISFSVFMNKGVLVVINNTINVEFVVSLFGRKTMKGILICVSSTYWNSTIEENVG